MDILAGMLAYLAGIGAIFAALAVSLVFFATPNEPPQTQINSHGANAMLVRPSHAGTPTKSGTVAAHGKRDAKESANQSAKESGLLSEKHRAVAGAAQASATERDRQRKSGVSKSAASTAQARRSIQEQRARRWAYQQDSTFATRFLGYSE
jgi:hypothetical protein